MLPSQNLTFITSHEIFQIVCSIDLINGKVACLLGWRNDTHQMSKGMPNVIYATVPRHEASTVRTEKMSCYLPSYLSAGSSMAHLICPKAGDRRHLGSQSVSPIGIPEAQIHISKSGREEARPGLPSRSSIAHDSGLHKYVPNSQNLYRPKCYYQYMCQQEDSCPYKPESEGVCRSLSPSSLVLPELNLSSQSEPDLEQKLARQVGTEAELRLGPDIGPLSDATTAVHLHSPEFGFSADLTGPDALDPNLEKSQISDSMKTHTNPYQEARELQGSSRYPSKGQKPNRYLSSRLPSMSPSCLHAVKPARKGVITGINPNHEFRLPLDASAIIPWNYSSSI